MDVPHGVAGLKRISVIDRMEGRLDLWCLTRFNRRNAKLCLASCRSCNARVTIIVLLDKNEKPACYGCRYL